MELALLVELLLLLVVLVLVLAQVLLWLRAGEWGSRAAAAADALEHRRRRLVPVEEALLALLRDHP